VNTILYDVENKKSGHPQVIIIIHCGTNDLTAATPGYDFISNISASISQAYIKFPKSKIIYSTLLPQAEIPLNTSTIINRRTYLKLFKTTQCLSCESLEYVQDRN